MARSKDPAVVRVAKRRYWREVEAEVAVGAWRRSGETLSGFARRYGIHSGLVGSSTASPVASVLAT